MILPVPLEIFFLVIFGAIFGSFFNVCIHRIPQNLSIAFPASHCPKCKTELKPWNNIPIFSYLIQKGKCSYCREKIHWHYFLVELITPLLFLLIYWRFSNTGIIIFFKYLIFISFSILIFFIDAFHQLIPDKLSLPLILIGVIFSLFPDSDITIKNSLVSGAVAFAFFYGITYAYYLYRKKIGLGGGDIKFIAAVGTFLGLAGVVFTILVGSVLALSIIIISRHDTKKHFPFGPALISAAILYLAFGDIILSWYLKFAMLS